MCVYVIHASTCLIQQLFPQHHGSFVTAMAAPAVTTLALAGPNARNPGDWPCQFCKKVQFSRDLSGRKLCGSCGDLGTVIQMFSVAW